ncbi:MAG: hypothetical protein ACI4KR_12315 [Ruminiclostridium sp.]
MNMILCSRNCRHQQEGYCCLEGRAVITNAVVSPCCYYEEKKDNISKRGKENILPQKDKGGKEN